MSAQQAQSWHTGLKAANASSACERSREFPPYPWLRGEATTSPSCHWASTSCLCARTSGGKHVSSMPFWVGVTFWILVSLESCVRGRKCPPFLIEKTDCPCLSLPVLCPFWLWWDGLPGRHLSLFRDPFLQDKRVWTQTYTNGTRSRDQGLPGLTIALMLVGLIFRNWGSHHVLTWNYPEPCARSLFKWDIGS